MEQLKRDLPEPLMMPGPRFGRNDGWMSRTKKWFKEHGQTITLVVIGLLIIAGISYLYSNYQKPSPISSFDKLSEKQQKEGMVKPEQIKIEEGATQQAGNSTVSAANKAEVVNAENAKITVKANKGAGVTHLAREALKKYLETNPELAQNLTPEHKIYIEDYLKDKTGSFPLKIDQELSFGQDLFKEAIDSSQKLSDKQLQNLHQYVLLVPSLLV